MGHQNSLASFNSPGHVAGAGDDLVVVEEAAAGEVARVAGKLPRHPDVPFPGFQAVYGANVVQTTARDERAGRGVRARHYPTRPKWDSVYFVGRVRVPDDKFAVL